MQMQQYLRMIQRDWWMIALTALAAITVALVAAYQTTPLYRSSARLIISPNAAGITERDLINSLGTLDKRSIAVTYAEILNSDRLRSETAVSLGLAPDQMRQYALNAVVLPEANILEISASGPEPNTAARIVNQVAELGIPFITKLYPSYDLSVLDPASAAGDPFTPQPARDMGLALALGLIAGVAIVILRGYLSIPVQAMRERVLIDSASGAFSRRHITRLIEEQATSSAPMSLMMVRADDLKDYLDVLPEASAHRLLQRMTHILRSELRGYDSVGRWSDTAFAITLPSTPESAAARTAERIRAALSQPIQIELQPDPFILSPRVATVTRQANEGGEALVQRVEQQLAGEGGSGSPLSGTRNVLA